VLSGTTRAPRDRWSSRPWLWYRVMLISWGTWSVSMKRRQRLWLAPRRRFRSATFQPSSIRSLIRLLRNLPSSRSVQVSIGNARNHKSQQDNNRNKPRILHVVLSSCSSAKITRPRRSSHRRSFPLTTATRRQARRYRLPREEDEISRMVACESLWGIHSSTPLNYARSTNSVPQLRIICCRPQARGFA